MFGMLIRDVLKDHVLQEEYIKDSKVAWTIVRPSAFTDEEGTGNYLHGFDSSQKDLEFKVAKADVAEFMLSQLHDDTYLYQTPGVSYFRIFAWVSGHRRNYSEWSSSFWFSVGRFDFEFDTCDSVGVFTG